MKAKNTNLKINSKLTENPQQLQSREKIFYVINDKYVFRLKNHIFHC